jgi:hypothetical protein
MLDPLISGAFVIDSTGGAAFAPTSGWPVTASSS